MDGGKGSKKGREGMHGEQLVFTKGAGTPDYL